YGFHPERGIRDPVPGPHPPTVANRDPEPPHHRRLERTHRGTQPGHQEGETSRPRLPKIRPLPTPLPPPRRRNQLAQPTLTTPNPNTPIPTRMRRADKTFQSVPSLSWHHRPELPFAVDHRFSGIDGAGLVDLCNEDDMVTSLDLLLDVAHQIGCGSPD